MKLHYRIKLQSITIFCFILIIMIALSKSGYAESSDYISSDDGSRIGLSVVYSPTSFAAWGKIKNSQSFSLRGQIWYTDFKYKNLTTRFGSELILTQHLNYPLNGVNGPRDQRLGFGLVPAKILVPFGQSAVKPFMFFSAGLLFLNEKLPAGDGASLNYLLNIGTGLEINISNNVNLQIGYSLQHLSNANSAGQNPGIDSHNLFFTVVL